MPEEQHLMEVKKTFPSGAQEWYCPTCGRHFIIQWPPNYKRIILDEGNELAAHAGGTDGLVMGQTDILPSQPDSTPPEAGDLIKPERDEWLSPWMRWFEDHPIKDEDE